MVAGLLSITHNPCFLFHVLSGQCPVAKEQDQSFSFFRHNFPLERTTRPHNRSVRPSAHRTAELGDSCLLSTLSPIYVRRAAHHLSFGRSGWLRLSMFNNCWTIVQIHWPRQSSISKITWRGCWPTMSTRQRERPLRAMKALEFS